MQTKMKNLNESLSSDEAIYQIDLSFVETNGEWYDGSCIEDGVPYHDGEISLKKKVGSKFVNFKTSFDDNLEFTNKEASDVIGYIHAAISEDLKANYSWYNQEKFDELEFEDAKLSHLCYDADKLVISIKNNEIKLVKKTGKGDWDNIDKFIVELNPKEIEADVKEYFEGYFDEIPKAFLFDIKRFIKKFPLSLEEALTFLVNMENEKVMLEIYRGNYSNFDIYDSKLFNDGYQDIIDAYSEENSDEQDLNESTMKNKIGGFINLNESFEQVFGSKMKNLNESVSSLLTKNVKEILDKDFNLLVSESEINVELLGKALCGMNWKLALKPFSREFLEDVQHNGPESFLLVIWLQLNAL